MQKNFTNYFLIYAINFSKRSGMAVLIGGVLVDPAGTPGKYSSMTRQEELVLSALHRLTGVAVATINASQANLVTNLKLLTPTLQKLADAGQSLPLALQVLLTYPFTNQVLKDVKGDYLNTYLKIRAAQGSTIIPPVKPLRKKKH